MMSPEEVWLALVNGYWLEREGTVTYKLRLPTLEVLHEARCLAATLEGSVGLPTQADIEELLSGDLSDDDREFLEGYPVRRKDLEVRLGFVPDQFKGRLAQELAELEARYERLTGSRLGLLSHSIEWHQSQLESWILFLRCVTTLEGEPLWDSIDAMLDSHHAEHAALFARFTGRCAELMQEKVLRGVAKDTHLRVMIKSLMESHVPVVADMRQSSPQLQRLLYYIHLYSNAISASTEDVPQEVVDDDDAFDRWLENRHKRFEQSSPGRRVESGTVLGQ